MNRRRMLLSTGTLLGALTPGLRAGTTVATGRAAGSGAVPTGLVALSDYESLARKRIPHMAYEYIAGGAADELTARWNRESFEATRLRPRALVDVENVDTRVRLFGQTLPHPVLLAPTAFHRLRRP